MPRKDEPDASGEPAAHATSPSLSARVGRSEAQTIEPSHTVEGGASNARHSDSIAETDAGVLDRIGPFRVPRVLGEGGMGVVYLAEQPSPRRQVALKVIRPGYASPAMMRRFELEAQVLGRLQHPGIAQVYDAGVAQTALGKQPYFAMEYVEGDALLDFMRGRRLEINDRLRLIARICGAVHHAHTKGIIHRDLKPGNILVTKEGHPKILDFGVARAIDADLQAATVQTDIGQLVGTLGYMSPEQVAGDPAKLDTRSDVYAPGVILYESLTGHAPYEVNAKSLAISIQTIAEGEPALLSVRDRRLRGDVETIVHKALGEEPDRRYQAAADLGADIERYLRHEPISARPPSTVYVLRKFARRNRALVTGLAVAAITLTAGVAGVVWQALRVTQQRNRAVAAEGVVETRRIEAEKATKLAEDRREDAEAKAAIAVATSDFLSTMLNSANPEMTIDRNVPVRAVLAQAAANADTAFRQQPAVEAAVRVTLGALYKNLGDSVAAERQYQLARDLKMRRIGAEGRETLEAQTSLAIALADEGRVTKAEPLAQQTLDAVRAKFGEK